MVIEEVSVIGAAGDRAKGRLGGSLAVQCQGGCQLLAGPGGGGLEELECRLPGARLPSSSLAW
jgi:hypothetical protein